MNDALRKILLPVFLAIVIIGWLLMAATHGEGKNKMQTLYDFKGARDLKPEIYHTNTDSIALFPVPQSNAVGTNDYRDAITIFSFPKGNLECREYFKRAVSSLSGVGEYLPVISPDVIGFGQMRRFVLFDFKNMRHEQYGIVFSIDETIHEIAIADAEKRRFIFEVKEYNRHSEDPHDSTYFLNLIDLEGRKVKLIKKIEVGKASTWSTAYQKLFVWYFHEKNMHVYDTKLEPSRHPLADVINSNRNNIDFGAMYSHPSLPFAILSGGRKGALIISWGEKKFENPKLLFFGVSAFSFSPDGKWVAFQKEDYAKGQKYTYIMPVSEKYPHYLGSPILLGRYFNEKYFAWTTDPISFVGSGLRYIYRWELTNEAHPESDKPTFHDYIVENDLERIAKEKK